MVSLTRRAFLTKLGLVTGTVYPGMMALGMLREAPVHPLPRPGVPGGKKVIILGAGLAGLTTAYELQKLGYTCTVLEARDRVGGRLFTVRQGSRSEELDNGTLVARFDPGQYFNAGPSRIPHHHTITLHYCREFGLPLEVYNNVNESTYYFSEGKGPLSGRKVRKREVHNDMRGYMAEFLHKAIDQNKLDTALTTEDLEKFLHFLRAEGGLDPDRLYKASARRGYTQPPGAGDLPGRVAAAYTLADIITSGLADPEFYNVAEYIHELQMTMFQVKGGNDGLARALAEKVKPLIRLQAEVQSVMNLEDRVQVDYTDPAGKKQLSADFCICTIPLPVLSNIDHNFSSDVSRAIDRTVYIMTGKIGMQFNRRFWEQDEMIYGGITYTNNRLYQIFYPSHDYLAKKGILTGYYHFNDHAKFVGDLSYRDREQLALEKGRLIHPQYDTAYDGRSFPIAWHKTKYSLGGWAIYSEDERQTLYKALLSPDKRVYFAGEHLTYLNGWMAGAFESARRTVTALHARVNETSTTKNK